MDSFPLVSVVVPCRNETSTIVRCIESIVEGDYPQERLEILVVDGASDDDTRARVEALGPRYPMLRLIANAGRTTPRGLNIGIRAAKGTVVLRVDAHSIVGNNYVRRCVEQLLSCNADNVGGIMHTLPASRSLIDRAIAASISHRFGVGNSHFRVHTREPLLVDTVFGGCYRREVFDRIGYFNEDLPRTQDMEFNSRLRAAGGSILLVPTIETFYFAQSGLLAFISKNYVNGMWSVLVAGFTPQFPLSIRHLVPLVAVAAAGVLFLLSPIINHAIGLLVLLSVAYAAMALSASAHAAHTRRDWTLVAVLPLMFLCLHTAYGVGSFVGLIRLTTLRLRRRQSGAQRRISDV
jgi:succinoglycan biosynthesis protein ExoA